MAITEFAAARKRSRVCLLGAMPSSAELEAFRRRKIIATGFTAAMRRPREMAATDSLILTQDAADLKSVYRDLSELGQKLLAFDCRIYVRVAAGVNLQGQEKITVLNAIRRLELPGTGLGVSGEIGRLGERPGEREGVPLAPYVYVCDSAMTWDDIAQLILENPSGEPPNLDLQPDVVDAHGRKKRLAPEEKLLLQRAFSDCSELHLRAMQDGLSGVSVFRAYARVTSGLEGSWPASFFVKLGARAEIGREYFNYQGHALKYIPFYLAPRLALERCGLGAKKGVIVGDFVEQAECLRDAAKESRATHALGTLFSRTLAAWRHNAREQRSRSIGDMLLEFLPADMDMPSERKNMVVADFGVTPDISAIRGLLTGCQSRRVLAGTIHGDLNPGNVLVRLSDAILIDFEKLKEGRPIIFDAASVEAGLLVDGFAADRRDASEWFESIRPLYDSRDLFAWRIPCHPKDGSSWFFDSVRQIRLQARPIELEPGQYAAALAVSLVRKSCNEHLFKDRRDRLRAAAYVLGEQILRSAVTASGLQPP